MHTISVKLAANAYPVYLGQGLLADPALWQPHLSKGKVLVVSNDTVAPLYLETLRSALAGREWELHIIPDGEQFKTVETWYGIVDKLVGMQARRDASLVALGGGSWATLPALQPPPTCVVCASCKPQQPCWHR